MGNAVVPYSLCDNNASQECDEATLFITVLDVQRDYGDGPAIYPAAWHRAVRDSDSNNQLDGNTDVWLGTLTSVETSQLVSPLADLDTGDDGISFGSNAGQFPLSMQPSTSYDVDITVNSSQVDVVHYGMWIDYDEDGTYDQFYSGSQATASPATTTVTITTPSNLATTGTGTVNVRLRVDDSALAPTDFAGAKTNGEVEDFQTVVVLPVELLSFNGKKEECATLLEWATASEINNDYFEVEYSNNGNDFVTIGRVQGAGNSTEVIQYSYLHENVKEGKGYYRLKQVDYGGDFSYSEVVIIDTYCKGTLGVAVYPNPAKGHQTNLSINTSEGKQVEMVVYDMTGKKIGLRTLSLEKGENIISIDVNGYIPGVYTIVLLDGNVSY